MKWSCCINPWLWWPWAGKKLHMVGSYQASSAWGLDAEADLGLQQQHQQFWAEFWGNFCPQKSRKRKARLKVSRKHEMVMAQENWQHLQIKSGYLILAEPSSGSSRHGSGPASHLIVALGTGSDACWQFCTWRAHAMTVIRLSSMMIMIEIPR